ncbi:MAG: hypothetical protein HDQ98_07520 [Lachnospiraceae bacterium]|nr:hypothetical protein [Lachnospiraceae bacterium]
MPETDRQISFGKKLGSKHPIVGNGGRTGNNDTSTGGDDDVIGERHGINPPGSF